MDSGEATDRVSNSFVCHELKTGMGFTRRKVPLAPVNSWEPRITAWLLIHFGELHSVGEGEHLSVDLLAARYEDVLAPGRSETDRFLDGADHIDSIVAPVFPASENDVGSSFERVADRLEGCPSHQQGVPHRHPFESGKILGDLPWEMTINPDDTIAADGGNDHDSHVLRLRWVPESKGEGRSSGLRHRL